MTYLLQRFLLVLIGLTLLGCTAPQAATTSSPTDTPAPTYTHQPPLISTPISPAAISKPTPGIDTMPSTDQTQSPVPKTANPIIPAATVGNTATNVPNPTPTDTTSLIASTSPTPTVEVSASTPPAASTPIPLIEGTFHEFTGSGVMIAEEFDIQDNYVCVYARGKYDIFTIGAYKEFNSLESYEVELLRAYFPENDSWRGNCTLVHKDSGFPPGTYAIRLSTYDETPWQLKVCASPVELKRICPGDQFEPKTSSLPAGTKQMCEELAVIIRDGEELGLSHEEIYVLMRREASEAEIDLALKLCSEYFESR